MKWNEISILQKNVFEFGDRKITQFVVFEWKKMFSIMFFYFHKSTHQQDRFHTHAFNSLSIKLWGSYDEHVLNVDGSSSIQKRTEIFKYFPRERFHKIGKGDGCCTLLISGPWNPTWKEKLNNDDVVEYYWNRIQK